MAGKIENFVLGLTREETKEALETLLLQAPQEVAMQAVKEWIKENGLEGEFEGLDE